LARGRPVVPRIRRVESSVEAPCPAALPQLGERARKRLRLAATFLRQRGLSFPKQGDFYRQVLVALEQQSDRDRIRELVDWVEAYDNAEAKINAGGNS
jgi:hypothetical protein